MSLDVLTTSINSMDEGLEASIFYCASTFYCASIFYCAAQQPMDESNRLRNALLYRRRGATHFGSTTQSGKLYVRQSTKHLTSLN
jgi:hypothetical protein